MKKISNLVIGLCFVAIIFTLSIKTVSNAYEDIKYSIDTNGVFHCKAEVESNLQENFERRNRWININGLFQKCIGTTIIRQSDGGDVYKLSNNQLMSNLDKQDMAAYADELIKLDAVASDHNAEFMYIQLPFKIENDSVMPLGCHEYGNENADELLRLISSDVYSIDFRSIIYEAGYEWEKLFFKTDHHWRPETAFWAAGCIAEVLSEQYGHVIDRRSHNISYYDVIKYEDWFLGSQGKRTGNWYSGVDDFSLITPRYETSFRFIAESQSGETIKRYGTFDDTMFDWKNISKKDYFNINTYAGYIGGDYKKNIITNNMAPNDKRILLIRDSFSCTLAPFLALDAKEITTIDLRHFTECSIEDYIKNGNFDLVIVAYNPSAFTEQQFDFFN